MFSFLFNQSLLNRALGEQQLFGDARSYAMGFSYSINTQNSSLIRYNPSLIGMQIKNNSFSFDFQGNATFIKERRSILVKDYFGDFLTYADYVNNDNKYTNFQLGAMKNISDNISVGFAMLPLASFSYNYIEEIRGSASVEEGDVGFKDPLVGYHVFDTNGKLNTLSSGLSFNVDNLNIGFGYHKIMSSTITDDIHVDSLTTEIENISLVSDYYEIQKYDDLKGEYYSLGISLKTNELLIALAFESDILIGDKTDYFNFENGAISYFNDDFTVFNPLSIHHYKPEKLFLGLSYNPINNRSLTVGAELEINSTYYNNNNLKDYKVYKLGFEYMLPSHIPIRGGLAYQTSAISLIPNQSIVTFGTGSKFKNIIYDLGASYSLFDYYYPDLFPIDSNIENSFDQITESRFNIIFTIKYLF